MVIGRRMVIRKTNPVGLAAKEAAPTTVPSQKVQNVDHAMITFASLTTCH
jgi:hypothetical protein